VFKWESGPALVQTVDFFTPIVDDPYTYGEIAAANALSDIYAMGGRPLTALAIAAFPIEGLDHEAIRAIFQGGFSKLREAGVALLGGHTVQDPEIKFGYAVTGAVDPARIISNAGANPGDVLFLTKPIGTGLIATALKFDRLAAPAAEEAVQSMRLLNRAAAEALQALPAGIVHACTDITGFGLAGHASEMARASGVTLAIDASTVPLFSGVLALAAANRSGGLGSNLDYFGPGVRVDPGVGPDLETVLFDPQTSGGLLIAVSPESADLVAGRMQTAGVAAHRVGQAVTRTAEVDVHVRP
jgi:selenide,water dikinase